MKVDIFKRREDVPATATEIVKISVVLESWATDLWRYADLHQKGTSCDPLYMVSGTQCSVLDFIRADCRGSIDHVASAIGSDVGDVVFIGHYANELNRLVNSLLMACQ